MIHFSWFLRLLLVFKSAKKRKRKKVVKRKIFIFIFDFIIKKIYIKKSNVIKIN